MKVKSPDKMLIAEDVAHAVEMLVTQTAAGLYQRGAFKADAETVKPIAGIAVIARNRRNPKNQFTAKDAKNAKEVRDKPEFSVSRKRIAA